MYNLHSHTLLSDGVLLPSEVAMRYLSFGYKAIAITDHADYSNIKSYVKAVLEFTERWPKKLPIQVLPGIELTHLPPDQFKPLAEYARKNGVRVIIGHGETEVEPVIKGTNRAALEADIDILAHPGLITEEEVKLAKEKGVFLEITSRNGHCGSNAHVAKTALKWGAKLILNNDSHLPQDIIPTQELKETGLKAGLTENDISIIYENVGKFLTRGGR